MRGPLKFWVSLFAFGLLCGCNMPTEPAQIKGAYVSSLGYENYSCPQLQDELGSLTKREKELVAAQQKRLDDSKGQAFWWGYGKGDGTEASELANIRGQEDAVRKAMVAKGCG